MADAGLDRLSTAPADEVKQLLRACCAAPEWVDAVAARRPYGDVEELLAASDAAVALLSEHGLRQALAGHPRIGERPAGPDGASSRREQRGVAGADAATRAALAEGNREYEERFGHVYLVCADGRSAKDLLAVLRSRLTNDPGTERGVTRQELAKINRIRLRRMVAGDEEAGQR